jgi:hypothetical protein
MNCRRVEQLLSHSLEDEGSLGEREIRALQAHLDRCPACRRLRDELRAVGQDLRELAHQLPLPESGSDRRAIDRWLAEQQCAPRHRGDWLRVMPRSFYPGRRPAGGTWPALSPAAFSSIAAALLLAALGLLLARSVPHRVPVRSVPVANGSPAPASRSRWRQTAVTPPSVRPELPVHVPHTPAPAPDRVAHSGIAIPVPDAGPHRASPTPARDLHGPAPAVDDLVAMNGDLEQQFQQWSYVPADQRQRIEERIWRAIHVREEFVSLPFPRIAGRSGRLIAEAVESYKQQAAIVDPRLSREVTAAFKGMALSDVCDRLRSDTGIPLSAGPSVADEKVTLFCEQMPLRQVLRQLARPFGYTWLRSGTPGMYRYELVQDLKSQLWEEEMRNQDNRDALLDVDGEMSQYRSYLNLSPDQALARAASASPEEKQRLAYLAGKGWGPAQLYFRLSPAELAELRAGQTLTFSASPGPGEQPLPPDMARDVLASLRDYRIARHGDSFDAAPDRYLANGQPPASVPEAQPMAMLRMDRSELGQLTLQGFSGFYIGARDRPSDLKLQLVGDDDRSLAVGLSPAARTPRNATLNARFAHDADLRGRVTVTPEASQGSETGGRGQGSGVREESELTPGARRLTSADVLEVLHRATGLPIVSDYYTRLFPATAVSAHDVPLFEALNVLADAMRLRWNKEPGAQPSAAGKAHPWLQFRSVSFYNDRLKEVPNRLLRRWAASRREHGALTLDDLIEIAGLTDAQLDSNTMAEGARVLYGLDAWDLARRSELRPHWRFLAGLTPDQRQIARNAAGLPFTRLSLAQQQAFLALLPSQIEPFRSLIDLNAASLQVDYATPGEFQWTPLEPDASPARRLQTPPRVRAGTRLAALQAARQIDPRVTEGQISPTDYNLALTYHLGGPAARLQPFSVHADLHNMVAHFPEPVTPDGSGEGRTVVSGGR